MKNDLISIFKKFLALFGTFVIIKITFLNIINEPLIYSKKAILLGVWYDLIPVSLYFLIFAFIYSLFYLLNRKASFFVTLATVFCLVVATFEAGLAFFTSKSGFLTDRELLFRSFNEMYTTVVNSGYLFRGFAFILIIISSFFIINFVLRKIRLADRWYMIAITVFSFIGIISLFIGINPVKSKFTTTQKYLYCVNKSSNLFSEFISYTKERLFFKESLTIYKLDNQDIVNLKEIRTDFKIENKEFPLMRKNDYKDSLGNYFKFNSQKPDIVIIIVESLGATYSGHNNKMGSFTPFIDSLANHCLYWPNCLATSQRTFAVLPSILGSLPHGNKGFQFGLMPEHNSLIKICKKNGYTTSFFYAGYPSFDCMSSFLKEENIDYIAPLFEKFLSCQNEQSTKWGLDDKNMFNESLNYLIGQNSKSPRLNVFLTITTHESLQNKEATLYRKKVDLINNRLPSEKKNENNRFLQHLAAFNYTDDALKDFVKQYLKKINSNTIFIITGDHGLEFLKKNELDKYHVPLLIYSPLLYKSQEFKAVVSSLDIAPTLVSLMESQKFFKKEAQISWLGTLLNTSRNFQHSGYNLFMLSSRKTEFSLGQYFLSDEALYEYDSLFNARKVENNYLFQKITDQYRAANDLDLYVYNQNKLFFDSITSMRYQKLYDFISSSAGEVNALTDFYNFSERIYFKKHYSKIRVIASGYVKFDTIMYQDQIPLVIELNESSPKQCFQEEVNTFNTLQSDIQAKKWVRFYFGRVFEISPKKEDINVAVYFWNHYKNPNNIMKVKDIRLTVEGL